MARTFDLSRSLLGLKRDGTVAPVAWESGPPPRIDGFVIGAPLMTRNAPHGGEMHPDADELLFLISGHIDVVLEESGGEVTVELRPGQATIVPRGTWHRVLLREPSQMLHITPGPGGSGEGFGRSSLPSTADLRGASMRVYRRSNPYAS